MKTLHRTPIPALALALLASACGPTEQEGRVDAEQEQPPAEELQSFSPGDGPDDEGFDAPSPTVEEAVEEAALEVEQGHATFYADMLEGRPTASGRTFRQTEMVAAHRAFPFGTRLRVTNLANGNSVEVEVVDRGPFGRAGSTPAVIDLSKAAAKQLDFLDAGRTEVRVEVLEWGP